MHLLRMMLLAAFLMVSTATATIPPKTTGFVPNKGQWPSDVLYCAPIKGGAYWVTKNGTAVDMFVTSHDEKERATSRRGHIFEVEHLGLDSRVISSTEAQTVYSYFLGNDPNKWASGLRSLTDIELATSFPGISLKILTDNGRPRYDYIVQPYADPNQIGIKIRGGGAVVSASGESIAIQTRFGDVEHGRIFAFQQDGAILRKVDARFQMKTDGSFGFVLGAYDKSKQLVIDPIVYGTYFGSPDNDRIVDMKVQADGHVVTLANSPSPEYRTSRGAYDTTYSGGSEVVIARFLPDLSTATFLTYLGGGSADNGTALSIDRISGDIFVCGETDSDNFPSFGGAQSVRGGRFDAFVVKLNAVGTQLLWGTYLGGSQNDKALAIDVDNQGRCVIGGETRSANFPGIDQASYQRTIAGGADGFLVRLRGSGSNIESATFVGGAQGDDAVTSVQYDRSSQSIAFCGFVAGALANGTFPVFFFPSVFDNSPNGGVDGFVGRISLSLGFVSQTTQFLSYLGSAGNDSLRRVRFDQTGDLYVTGAVTSTSGLTLNFGSFNGVTDILLAKVAFDGRNLLAVGVYGGRGADSPTDFQFVPGGNDLFVVGSTTSIDLPVIPLPSALGNLNAGATDGFVFRVTGSLSSAAGFGAYYGTRLVDIPHCVHVTRRGDLIIAGETSGNDLWDLVPPERKYYLSGQYQAESNGGVDGFVIRFAFGDVTLTNPTNKALYCQGSEIPIQWGRNSMSDLDLYNIDLSADSGKTWTSISTGRSGTNFLWTIPFDQKPGSNYIVRVINPESGIRDVSNEAFGVGAGAQIVRQLRGDTVCAGDTLTLSVGAVSVNDLTYEWRKNGVRISGANRPELKLENVSAQDNGSYAVFVSAGCQLRSSDTVAVRVRSKTRITISPKGDSIDIGSRYKLIVAAVGEDVRYQWFKNGLPIPNATNSEFVITSANETNAGAYKVVVRGRCGTDSSVESQITVKGPNSVTDLTGVSSIAIVGEHPVQSVLSLQLISAFAAPKEVKILDILGRVVQQVRWSARQEEKFDIDCSALENGVYWVSLESTQRLVPFVIAR